MVKSNYNNSLQLGGALYPELLGDEVSLLKKERESDTTKEYRQKALLSSIRDGMQIEALDLVKKDISEYEDLLSIAEQQKGNKQRVDQLKRKLGLLHIAKKELAPEEHSENKLIFRDAYNANRAVPTLLSGNGYRDFELPLGNVLRLRVLHPDKVEHITGADLIYERHSLEDEMVSIVAIQYKIWEKKRLYLSDERMTGQIEKMNKFLCGKNICTDTTNPPQYRFPCCSAFLRPTDKLQKSDQALLSTGEHLPICKINGCKSKGDRDADILEYEKIKEISLSAELFEFLFNRGKIGSRKLTYGELSELYKELSPEPSENRVLIYAQEFDA